MSPHVVVAVIVTLKLIATMSLRTKNQVAAVAIKMPRLNIPVSRLKILVIN